MARLDRIGAIGILVASIVACSSETSSNGFAADEVVENDAGAEVPPVDPVEVPDMPKSEPVSDASVPDPKPAPTPGTYASEKTWAEAHGVTIDVGKATVVAKRYGADKRVTVYEDTIVVFKADGTLATFIGNTKPAQMPRPESGVVPDVDGDGRKDLGIVRPGIYMAHGSTTFGLTGYERAAFKVRTLAGDNYLPAWRDLSGDGDFSASEKSLAAQRDYKISGIYIHYGFAPTGTKLGTSTYVGPWSVGCQNIQYPELDKFVQAVGGASAVFKYAIVDAD